MRALSHNSIIFEQKIIILKCRLMRIVCGLDVHKDGIYLCILSSTVEIIEKVFGVLTLELYEMRDFMLKLPQKVASSFLR